jgi:osmotically-inducible protein OsmY
VFLYGCAYSLEERANLETLAMSVPGVSAVENYVFVNLFA